MCPFATSLRARSMPISSIAPAPLSRIPAVSTKTRGTPPIETGRSSTSLVVPASLVTMAASSDSNALNSDDFPALGGPASTTRMPSLNRSVAGRCDVARISPISSSSSREKDAGSDTSSSSAKSITASIDAARPSTRSRHPSIRRDKSPPAASSAPRRCNSVSAESKSARPSASARSIRPLLKARRVNSPGSASRNPSILDNAARRAATTARPPWQ